MSDRRPHPPGDTQVECESRAGRVKAVTVPGDQTTDVVFAANGVPQQFGNIPLLTTDVTVDGPGASCLIAHFSGEVQPLDNGIFFQARVDGVPMKGQFSPGFGPVIDDVVFESFYPAQTLCLLVHPNTASLENPSPLDCPDGPNSGGSSPVFRLMLSYNFFARVTPGVHIVEVFFAGCCSIGPEPVAARVGSPVLTLEHR